VLTLLDTESTAIAAILGILKAAKYFVALNPRLPQVRLKLMAKDSRASLILTSSSNMALACELADNGCDVINVETARSFSSDNLELAQSPHSIAYIVYTSGSTGRPKGVVHSHRNLLFHSMCHINYFHIGHNDRMTLLHACNSPAAYPDLFGALLSGAALYPWDLWQEGMAALPGWLLQEGLTIFNWAATPFRRLIESVEETTQFPSLRIVMLGSEPIFKRDLDLYKKHFSSDSVFVARFGSAEAPVFRYLFLDRESEIETRFVPAGYAIAGKDVLLLDEAGGEVGFDCIGEISVQSAYIALGYYQEPELTEAAFLSDPAGQDRRIYRTGDMGILRSDGALEFVGRKDFQVKIRGYRVELGEIESALRALVAIKEAVVVAREDENGEKRLAAYFVPAADPPPSLQELRSALSKTLPDYMIPLAFAPLDALPLTPAGKVDRQALREPERMRPDLEPSFVPPRTPIEARLAEIWAQVLNLDRVGIHDNFLELGGDSMLATQLFVRVREEFGVETTMIAFFDMPTIALQAKHMEEAQQQRDEVMGALSEIESLSDAEAQRLLAQEAQ
jgi:amino acid adenylation domain-containing protein